MSRTHTHTVVTLAISKEAYKEIHDKLEAAQYEHLFLEEGAIDMTGIAIVAEEQERSRDGTAASNELSAREHIYFTLYDDPRYQNNSLDQAEARVCAEVPHRFIRLELRDEGDGLEIKDAEFMDHDTLRAEQEANRELAAQMKSELEGDDNEQ